ncbi:MAG: InlB B-repeat-containing protein [Microcella sp.]|uniref:InlB B-repeat-containing protein n=1 Tax=Microcella sp. TaxID=1913979 RepID=UPI003314B5AD
MTRAALPVLPALLAAAVALPLIATGSAAAAPVGATDDDFTYIADDADIPAGATVDNYTGSGSTAEVPRTVVIEGNTYEVTIIGEFAFGFRSMSGITLPDTVTTIEYGAFVTNSLVSFTVPRSVTTIGGDAFFGNPLASVQLLGPAPALGADAFGAGGDAGPLLTYPWRYDATRVAEGYTSPVWQGYRSQAVATVAFDTMGGSAAPGDEHVVVGSTISEPEAPTREGFAFGGWSTAPSDGSTWSFATPLDTGTLAAADTGASPADLVLYAQWAPVLAATGPAATAALGWSAVGLLAVGLLVLTGGRAARCLR